MHDLSQIVQYSKAVLMRRSEITLIFFIFVIHTQCIAQNINTLNINLKSEKIQAHNAQSNLNIPPELVNSLTIPWSCWKQLPSETVSYPAHSGTNKQWATDAQLGKGIVIASEEVREYFAKNVCSDKKPILRRWKSAGPIQQRPSFLSLDMNAVLLTNRPLDNTSAEGAVAFTSIGWGMEGAWFPIKNYGFGGGLNSAVFSNVATISDLNQNTHGQQLEMFSAEVGQYFSFPLPQNWFITGKLLTGISSMTRQRFLVDEKTDNHVFQSPKMVVRYPSNVAVNWTFGVGAHKMIAKNVALKAQVTYAISNHKLLVERGTPGQPISLDGKTEKVALTSDRLSVGLGLSAFLW